MTLHDDLVAAKALIADPAKWGKGSFALPDGCLCALGAVAKVCQFPPDRPWVGHPSDVRDCLTRALPGSHRVVVSFNDHPDTTHADIMALFDRAINASRVSPTEGERG